MLLTFKGSSCPPKKSQCLTSAMHNISGKTGFDQAQYPNKYSSWQRPDRACVCVCVSEKNARTKQTKSSGLLERAMERKACRSLGRHAEQTCQAVPKHPLKFHRQNKRTTSEIQISFNCYNIETRVFWGFFKAEFPRMLSCQRCRVTKCFSKLGLIKTYSMYESAGRSIFVFLARTPVTFLFS